MADILDSTSETDLGRQILAELDERDQAEQVANQRRQEAAARLSASRLRIFREAIDHKQRTGVNDRLIDCKRRRDGEYDEEKLAIIRRASGSETYANITVSKCRSGEAWTAYALQNKLFKPCGLTPTPLPELSDADMAAVQASAMQLIAMNPEVVPPGQESEFLEEAYDELRREAEREATEKAARMEKLIDDQRDEGGYVEAMSAFLYHFFTYPAAVFKGPYVEAKGVPKWNGTLLEERVVPVKRYRALSPYDVFPAPNSDSPQSGPFCELDRIDASRLAQCKGLPGWSDEAIEEVLSGPLPTSLAAYSQEEMERARQESRDTSVNDGIPTGSAVCVWVWDRIRGKALMEAGFEPLEGFEPYDPDKFYDTCCLLVGTRVVYAARNPNPLEIRPYFHSQFQRVPGSFWGVALPEVMKHIQDAANAALRNAIDRMAFAARPQVAVDSYAIDAACNPSKLVSGKIWSYDGEKMRDRGGSGKPIDIWFMDPMVQEYMRAYYDLKREAQDLTGIPDYIQGTADVPGAGQTASGMSMLMGNAAKGLQMVMSFIDIDVLRPQMMLDYLWNLKYLPDDQYGALKGDCAITPRGVMASLFRDQQNQLLKELLAMFNTPEMVARYGEEFLLAIVKAIIDRVEIPEVSEKLPDADEMRLRGMQQAQLPPPMAGAAAPQPPQAVQTQNAITGGLRGASL